MINFSAIVVPIPQTRDVLNCTMLLWPLFVGPHSMRRQLKLVLKCKHWTRKSKWTTNYNRCMICWLDSVHLLCIFWSDFFEKKNSTKPIFSLHPHAIAIQSVVGNTLGNADLSVVIHKLLFSLRITYHFLNVGNKTQILWITILSNMPWIRTVSPFVCGLSHNNVFNVLRFLLLWICS